MNTVLIVEDKRIIAFDLKCTIKKWGLNNSVIFGSGKKAIDYINTYSPVLAILDIRLADDISGIEVAKKLKHKNIPFIFISAFSDPNNLKLAKELNPFAILKKPLFTEQLSLIIEKFLEKENGKFDNQTINETSFINQSSFSNQNSNR